MSVRDSVPALMKIISQKKQQSCIAYFSNAQAFAAVLPTFMRAYYKCNNKAHKVTAVPQVAGRYVCWKWNKAHGAVMQCARRIQEICSQMNLCVALPVR